MFDIIPKNIFENPNLTWLDPGSGTGNFSIALYFKLLEHLKQNIPDIEERKDHIIKNMIFMVELQPENTEKLRNLKGNSIKVLKNVIFFATAAGKKSRFFNEKAHII